jgi:diketogulonate reductase-like aldo/keto reductase
MQLGVSYVDLYLIHNPRLANGDIPGLWKQFQQIQAKGLAKCVHTRRACCLGMCSPFCLRRSIGVSNFNVADLTTLLKDAKVKPAVNQVRYSSFSKLT